IQTAKAGERIPVILQYRDATQSAIGRLGKLLRRSDLKYTYQNFPAIAASMTSSQIRHAAQDPMLDHVELDAVMKACMNTATESLGVQSVRTQFKLTGDGDGNIAPYSASDVGIAIIDTGIDESHPDLKGKILYWKDFINRRSDPYDDEGHGTHVAGVAAGA